MHAGIAELKLVTLAHLAPQSAGVCPYKVLPGMFMVLRYAPRAPHASDKVPASNLRVRAA